MLYVLALMFGALGMYLLSHLQGWYSRTVIDPSTDCAYLAVKHRWFVTDKGWDTKEIEAEGYEEAKLKADAWHSRDKRPENCAVKLIVLK